MANNDLRHFRVPVSGYTAINRSASACSASASVTCRNVAWLGAPATTHVFRHRVPRWASNVRKLWTGRPSDVACVLFFRFADSEARAGATGSRRGRSTANSSSSNSSGSHAWRRCHST